MPAGDSPDRARTVRLYGLIVVAVGGLSAWSITRGDLTGGIGTLAVLTIALWWGWPGRGPHLDEEAARRQAEPGDLIVYWRPGCTYCTLLSLQLRLTRFPAGTRRLRVNIWRDPHAAATVRLLRSGFETVPTVTTPDGELVESSTRAMAAATSDSLPA